MSHTLQVFQTVLAFAAVVLLCLTLNFWESRDLPSSVPCID